MQQDKETRDPTLGISQLTKDTADILSSRLERMVRDEESIFPSFQDSLDLLSQARQTGIIDRMVREELTGGHSILSHSLFVLHLATSLGRQANELSLPTIGTHIVDVPLLSTSSFLHDMGNLINRADIERWGLDEIDLFPYTQNYPPHIRDRIARSGPSHILKTVAFLEKFGFTEHAHTAAHSMYHLLIPPKDIVTPRLHIIKPREDPARREPIEQIEQKGIGEITPDINTFERLLLMLSDFSVVSLPEETGWPRARYVPSLVHKMNIARARHETELAETGIGLPLPAKRKDHIMYSFSD